MSALEDLAWIFAWEAYYVFLLKKYFSKKNMALRAQFQMLILVSFSQTTN